MNEIMNIGNAGIDGIEHIVKTDNTGKFFWHDSDLSLEISLKGFNADIQTIAQRFNIEFPCRLFNKSCSDCYRIGCIFNILE